LFEVYDNKLEFKHVE
jgi:hypothetical protein